MKFYIHLYICLLSAKDQVQDQLQEQILHSVLTGLNNEKSHNELRPFLKERALEDEKLLKRLTFAMTDENERQRKLSNTPKKTDIKNSNFEETLENTKKKKK